MSANNKPQFPLYIPTKGRHDRRLTINALQSMGLDFYAVIEEAQYHDYASVIDKKHLLVLDPAYQREYETLDELGDSKSKGPGPARNFAWDHAKAAGHGWHWVMDDNIWAFYRLHKNTKIKMADGAGFKAMEDFCLRYTNVAMAGPNYESFVVRREKTQPFVLNTRIYSCNLIRNDIPFRWRGRYNEDTILSLDMLSAGWVTVQFNAFLQNKIVTQALKGGNTQEFYDKEGTRHKSEMLARVYPKVAKVVWRFGRIHHHVDYRPFKGNTPRLRPGVVIPDEPNNYGMVLRKREK
jgi:hypothetical protein